MPEAQKKFRLRPAGAFFCLEYWGTCPHRMWARREVMDMDERKPWEQAAAVLGCAAVVIFLTVLIAAVSILRKKPREILADLS